MKALLRFLSSWGLLITALGIVLIIGSIQPRFLSATNLENISRQSSFLLIFALAQMLPVMTRGLDLSQGGVVAVTGVLFALAANIFGIPAALVIAVIVGTSIGWLNGFLVASLRVSPFVVTLGVGSIATGAALIMSNGQPIFAVPDGFSQLGNASIGPLPVSFLIGLVVWAGIWSLFKFTVPGRFLIATGSSPDAALLSGVPVQRMQLTAYMASGMLTALGACLLASRINTGHPTVGADTALQAVAAVVVGGVSLYGGRGSALGVGLAAIFLGMLANALNLLNISAYTQTVMIGAAIIFAVLLDQAREKLR